MSQRATYAQKPERKQRATDNKQPEEAMTEQTTTILRAMVKGAYDLQLVRMQTGIRLIDNFRAKLGLKRKDDEELDEAERERLEEEAEEILDRLRASYKRLT